MRIAFYDAGQALAALVTLPDGKTILVDAGESPTRAGCGAPCKAWHARVLAGLEKDVPGGKIDMVWNTHPHSDHLGGLPGVGAKFEIGAYVHNGRDTDKATVKKAIGAANDDKATVVIVEPGTTTIPLPTSEDVKLTAIVPDAWASICKTDANACSILLRIDYCESSVLFTGDAEKDEEPHVNIGGPVGLLQVGHHGSDTSSTADFLKAVAPKYAVISSGKQGDGTNKTYCHPIKSTVDAVTAAIGGPATGKLRAYDNTKAKCNKQKPAYWSDVPSSDTLWSTARDGMIVLTTNGDGKFAAAVGQ